MLHGSISGDDLGDAECVLCRITRWTPTGAYIVRPITLSRSQKTFALDLFLPLYALRLNGLTSSFM